MQRFIAILISVLAQLSLEAAADEPKRLGPFTAFCEEDYSLGLSWEDEAWTPSKFEFETWVARKVVDYVVGQSADGSYNWCRAYPNQDDTITPKRVISRGCYGIARKGSAPTFDWCSEDYRKDSAGWILAEVHCDSWVDFKFRPNGLFSHRSDLGDVDPKAAYKDSFAISAGKCSIVG